MQFLSIDLTLHRGYIFLQYSPVSWYYELISDLSIKRNTNTRLNVVSKLQMSDNLFEKDFNSIFRNMEKLVRKFHATTALPATTVENLGGGRDFLPKVRHCVTGLVTWSNPSNKANF